MSSVKMAASAGEMEVFPAEVKTEPFYPEDELDSTDDRLGESQFVCGLCGTGFVDEAALNGHIGSLHNGAPAKVSLDCDECDLHFDSLLALATHNGTFHISTGTSQLPVCKFCFKTYKKTGHLVAHVKKCHADEVEMDELDSDNGDEALAGTQNEPERRPVKRKGHKTHCKVCNINFGTVGKYRTHRLEHHTKKSAYRCDQCDRDYTQKASLVRHVQEVHLGSSKEHRCDECGRMFIRESHLKQHAMSVHGDSKNFSCVECMKFFSVKGSLQRHLKKVHGHGPPADRTGTEAKTPDEAQPNLTSGDPGGMVEPKSEEPPNDNKVWIKQEAPLESFASDCQQSDFGQPLANEYQCGWLAQSPRNGHECDNCGMAFSSRNDLKKHLRSAHKDMKLRCDMCEKFYFTARDLAKHVSNAHNDSGVFQCDQCFKTFARKGGLKRHMSDVHQKDQKKFACDMCGKLFTRSSQLQEHRQHMHNGRRDFVCEICMKRFVYKNSMNRHMREFHQADLKKRTIVEDECYTMTEEHMLESAELPGDILVSPNEPQPPTYEGVQALCE